MSRLVYWAALVLALPFAAAGVHAQDKYPSKPIRVLSPFAPGGGTDILARIIGPQVSESLGQPVVVENRPGGGGTLGAAIVVRADPDGYTLILVSGSYGANAALHDLPYDSVTDIQPIILIGTTGLLVSMHPSVPVKTIKQLIAYARANPGKLNFGSAGTGGLGHLAGELFKLDTNWYGLWGPKGLPKDIVTRWNAEVARVLHTDAMKKWLAQEGLEPAGGPPEEFQNRIRGDVEKWKKVVKEAKIAIAK